MAPFPTGAQNNDRQQLLDWVQDLRQYLDQIEAFIRSNQYGFIVTEANLIYGILQLMRPVVDRLRAPNQEPQWELPNNANNTPASSGDGGAFVLGIIVGAIIVLILVNRA